MNIYMNGRHFTFNEFEGSINRNEVVFHRRKIKIHIDLTAIIQLNRFTYIDSVLLETKAN